MLRHAVVFASFLTLAACGGGGEALDPAQVEAGRVVFGACATCHSTDAGAGHKVGPNLYAVVGAPAGAKPGYDYSEALASSGLVWDEPTLDAYLENPTGTVPGGKMIYAGLRDPQDRARVITYLKSKQ